MKLMSEWVLKTTGVGSFSEFEEKVLPEIISGGDITLFSLWRLWNIPITDLSGIRYQIFLLFLRGSEHLKSLCLLSIPAMKKGVRVYYGPDTFTLC